VSSGRTYSVNVGVPALGALARGADGVVTAYGHHGIGRLRVTVTQNYKTGYIKKHGDRERMHLVRSEIIREK
jgi:hypothetical protein